MQARMMWVATGLRSARRTVVFANRARRYTRIFVVGRVPTNRAPLETARASLA